MKTSKLFSLNTQDYIKGFVTAVLCAIIIGLHQGLTATPPHFPATWADWQAILLVGVSTGIAYLAKNVFTNSEGKLFKAEPK